LPWIYGNGADEDNSLLSSKVLTDSDYLSTHNESGITASTHPHLADTAAEWEFTIRNNGASTSTVYYFRAWDQTNNASVPYYTDKTYPSLVTQTGDMTYSLQGLESGTTTEGIITNITTSANSVTFGTLLNSESIGAYRFNISTNAGSGYRLFARQSDNLKTNSDKIFDPVPYANENPNSWPIIANPSNFGYHTGDDTLSGPSPSRFLPDNTYAKFENTNKEVGYSPVPVNNDIFNLIYRANASGQQPAGDYFTRIIYILVPTY
jgi:hypothetical protein